MLKNVDLIEISILHYLIIYIHFMMEMGELVRYYLLTVSVRGYDFNNTSSIINRGIQVHFHRFYILKFGFT